MTLDIGTLRENLLGAWAVMIGRPEGLKRLDASLEGFWRSFGAIVLVVPFALLALASQRRLGEAAGAAADPVTAGSLAPEGLALLADWFAFPLLFALFAGRFGLGNRYVPFIVARNWGSVVVSALLGVLHVTHLVGLIPAGLAPFLMLVGIALALRFSYMIARVALGVSLSMALAIVTLDFLLSLTIWSLMDRLAS